MAALGLAGRALALRGRAAGPRAWPGPARGHHGWTALLSLRAAPPARGEPLRKKKKVDPRMEQAAKERLRKRIKKLEKAAPELVPIEDFITPAKCLLEDRQRPEPQLPPEARDRRTWLMRRWAGYKQQEQEAEREKVAAVLGAQRRALRELRLESEPLYLAAARRDPGLFPFEAEGPSHTPATPGYQAPEGKYNDVTRVYLQVLHKR
ncbi:large ribosomal subunit protein mL40 [Macrotis lagotis]|uniref:large ribosomal subunit protein mL40 n=1 Tax=Macrotis lagotis TaxID=92651 RepID=UPI003D687BB7